MPHAIVEYSRALEAEFEASSLMQAVHACLLQSGQFSVHDIKVRLYPCDHAFVAGRDANFLHITVYMLSGRSRAIKKNITSDLLQVLDGLSLIAASLSVDARDMDRDVYSKMVG
jgi:5-carboxymethyl-2-hydroxymuconate isomerase